MRRALAAAVLSALAIGIIGIAGAVPASAAAPRIRLLEQPAWTPLGGDLPLRLALDGAADNLEVRAVVHAFLTSRIGFERTLDGERLTSVIGSRSSLVSALPTAPSGGRVLTLGLQDPNASRDANRLRLPLPRGVPAGVYPVEVELRDPSSGQRISGFVTYLVATSPAAAGAATGAPVIGAPLRVSWIWRLLTPPATRPDGKLTTAFTRSVGAGGRLAGIATALGQARGVPLVVAPSPETLAAWSVRAEDDATAASGIAAVRAAAGDQQVLTAPYVPIDGPSLTTAGLGDEVGAQLAQGEDTLDSVLDTRVDPRTSALAPLDAATLDRLQLSQVDRLVVAPGAVSQPAEPNQFTPAHPFTLESNGKRFTAVESNADLGALLNRAGAPALRAQRFLAGLAVVALEQPNEPRGVAIDTPRLWNPATPMLGAVITGLRDNPLLAPVTLDRLFDGVPQEKNQRAAATRQLAPALVGPPPVSAAAYRTSRAHLTALASMVGDRDPAIARGTNALSASLTNAWPGAVGTRHAAAQLAGIDASVNAVTGGIQAPQARTVTLTSRRASIPVSLENKTGRDVRVRVRVESSKLKFPNGQEKVLTLKPQNTTTTIDVETRASGTFPIRVLVTSADGALPLGRVQYTVRSTVVSGVGIFLTIGAGLFLAIWWLTHWRKSRRRLLPTALPT